MRGRGIHGLVHVDGITTHEGARYPKGPMAEFLVNKSICIENTNLL